MPSNYIPRLQNDGKQLKLLRARTQIYSYATAVTTVQMLLAVIMPFGGAILTLLYLPCRPYVAAASLMAIVFDAFVLDRLYKSLLKRAAKIAEQFDTFVLDLPWDSFNVGEKVDAEDIHTAAQAYSARHGDSRLQDWYPVEVGRCDISHGRIICQRTNLRYDSRLRRSYGVLILIIAWAIVMTLFIAGLVQQLTITQWVLLMAPATPLLSWTAREYYRQRDTAAFLEELMKKANQLWDRSMRGECDEDEYRRRSRDFQSAIYRHRASSPLIIPFLYGFMRSQLEGEMHAGATELLRELSDAEKRGAA